MFYRLKKSLNQRLNKNNDVFQSDCLKWRHLYRVKSSQCNRLFTEMKSK